MSLWVSSDLHAVQLPGSRGGGHERLVRARELHRSHCSGPTRSLPPFAQLVGEPVNSPAGPALPLPCTKCLPELSHLPGASVPGPASSRSSDGLVGSAGL